MKRMAALAMAIPLLWAQADRGGARTITAVRHWSLGDVTRVAVEVSGDFKYRTDSLHNPERVYFDILNARPHIGSHSLFSISLDDDERVKRLRVAETSPSVTRIVLDLAGPSEVTTTQLANPDRLMIEVRAGKGPTIPVTPPTATEPVPAHPEPPTPFGPATRQVKAIVAPGDLASAEMVVAEPSKSQLGPAPAANSPANPEEGLKNGSAPDGSHRDPGSSDSGAAGGAGAGTSRPAAGSPATESAEPGKGTRRDAPSAASGPALTESAKAPRRDSTAGSPGSPMGPALTDIAKTPRHDSGAGSSAPSAEFSPVESGRVLRYDSAPPSEPPAPSAASAPSGLAMDADTGKAARHTANGDNSLVRELGLKISRVVIDPGHGGHDQGTQGPKGLMEKELVLDVSKRLGKLIEEKMGAEVIYTRTDDTFIPLERRTALANEKKADLFLSIHANASPVTRITGVETYYLNFADTKDAADVASRENANAHASIFELRDMVQKITLHDKAEESKDFASRIQSSLYAASVREIPGTRNRGVKKAPFVVLIGAQMPSVLAEIGFLSNPREEALLKRPEYRQKLAEALYRGVQRYADSLSHFQVAQTQNP